MHLQHEAEVKASRPERADLGPESHLRRLDFRRREARCAPGGYGARPASTAGDKRHIDIEPGSSEFAFRL